MQISPYLVARMLGCVGAFLLFVGCQSSPTASYDFATGAEFGGYRTFAWISEHPLRFHDEMQAHASPLLEEHLKSAALSSFAQSGLKYVDDPQSADLLMGFTVGSRETITSSGYFGYYGPAISGDPYASGYWSGGGRAFRRVTDGRVCVDLFDRRTRKPIWHGMAEEALDQDDVEYWRNRVPTIVEAIVAGYPPE